MGDPVIVFRTSSDVEAAIVRALLDAHGIRSAASSNVSHSAFPLAAIGMSEVRVSVNEDEAAEAARVIASHRTEIDGGHAVRLRDEFEDLQKRIGYRFRDAGLLEHAMTHTSRANEDVSGGVADNESLEFLGDAVLGFIAAELLFRRFPETDEGYKSKMKASLVSTATLARLADRLRLGDELLLGRGEEKTGGRRKQALLADGYEALIAAIYLDGGVDAARTFIVREFGELLSEAGQAELGARDYKSALQEQVQAHGLPLPEYRLAGTVGPDHRKLFRVELRLRGEVVAEASGTSKKEAEQEAARQALVKLGEAGALNQSR